MKQYITVDQLKELNTSQLKKLNELRFLVFIQSLAYKDDFKLKVDDMTYVEAAEDLNIGVMIEILSKQYVIEEISQTLHEQFNLDSGMD